MKTKTALIRAFFFLTASVLLLVLYGVFLPRVLYGAISVSLEKNEMESAYKLTDIMIRFFPSHEKTQDLILSSLPSSNGIDAVYTKDIVIGPWFSSQRHNQEGTVRVDENFSEKILRVAEAQKMEMWKWNVYERLGLFLTSSGSYIEAEDILTKAAEGFEELTSLSQARRSYYFLAKNARASGNKEMDYFYLSIAGSEKFDECSDTDGVLAELGHLYLEKGMLDEAEKLFNRTISSFEEYRAELAAQGQEAFDIEIQRPWQRSRNGLKMIESFRSQNGGKVKKVSGSITFSGTPLSGVSAYLMPYEENSMYMDMGFDYNENTFSAVSDEEGLFNFFGVPEASYKVIFGFSAYQLKDAGKFHIPEIVTVGVGEDTVFAIQIRPKFAVMEEEVIKPGYEKAMQFSWEPVNDAENYEIRLFVKTENGSFGHSIASGADTLYTILIRDTNSLREDFGSIPEDEPILAATVTIQAVDKDGHILTDSAGLVYDANEDYPIIFLK
ncbi:MAG TPA: carboxypeptidase-like regulatory domain-containing protein [Treponemataceae bacterium]|nr:carboxypeptidase-like regulatory domain-containing protein [Treponemataceae bacterium]